MNDQVDYFICHASEDKQSFVRNFAQYLMKNDATVFYDEYSLKLGDSLTEKINDGISRAKAGIIILSKYFFEKPWTNAELQGIFQRHLAKECQLIIIYHGIDHEDVRKRYPLLADIYATTSNKKFPELAREIFEATSFSPSLKFVSSDLADKFTSVLNQGFSIAIQLQLHPTGDPGIDKCIFDFGDSVNTSRLTIKVIRNNTILCEICDNSGRSLSVRTSATPFFEKPHLLLFQVSHQRSSIELYVAQKLVSKLDPLPAGFAESISLKGGFILFNSSELIHPCPATISFYAANKEVEPTEVAKLANILDDWLDDLAKADNRDNER